MTHPKDRDGLTRRQLLGGAAGGAVAVGALAGLAACQNTTTPIGVGGAEESRLVVPKPRGPGGLPLPRPDNAVTWAITDDNPPIADGVKDEAGPLAVYNYASYIDPGLVKQFEKLTGRKVEIATYNSASEAVAKLASGAVGFDVIIGLTGAAIVSLISQQLLQPLNHSYLPNLERNVWPGLQNPFYDRGSRYTVPYVLWQDGIGWRRDMVTEDIGAMDVPWDIFWESQAYRGKVGLLDDYQDGLSMPIQRDGLRDGVRRDLNTEDPAVIDRSGRDLEQLIDICNIKVTITGYQTLPEGRTAINHVWAGDMLAAAFYYLPKGTPPTVLGFWGPEENGVVGNDYFCIGRTAKNPALAHRFINFFLDDKIAYQNFINFNGYMPPQNSISAESLIRDGLIPKTLTKAVIRPEQFASNQQLLQLSVEGDRVWQAAWSRFRAG